MEKPNLILIFTDQQRWDTLQAYGNPIMQTPKLDRMAEEGAVFENAITPCPICMPARACTMTGYTASKIGCLNNEMPKNVDTSDTMAGYLKQAGYYTQAIGKMHFSNNPYQENYGMDNMILSEETRGVRFAKESTDVVFDDYDKFLMDNNL